MVYLLSHYTSQSHIQYIDIFCMLLSMALSGNEDALNEIEMALRGVLQEKGHFPYVKRSWIKKKLNDKALFPNQEWTNPNLLNSSVQILVEEVLKLKNPVLHYWMKSLPFKQPRSWSYSSLKDYSVHRVYPLAELVRQWLWNTSEAPFADNPEGRELALSWFMEASREADRAKVQHPGQVEISIFLQTDDVAKLMAIAKDWRAKQLERVGSVSGQASTSELADIIAAVDSQAVGWEIESKYETSDGRSEQYPQLVFTANEDPDKTIMAHPGTLLGELAARVSKITSEAMFWSDRDTLNFILYGKLLDTIATTSSYKESRAALALQGGEGTREEIESTRKWLDILAPPKSLSASQKAVLALVAETPGLSWKERYKQWLEWCDRNPELPDFNRNSKAGPPSLHNTYKRAVEKEKELAKLRDVNL